MSDLKLKLTILGDEDVGKSSILNRFVNQDSNRSFKSCTDANFSTKKISIDGKDVIVQVCDASGQERSQSLGPTLYRGTDGCILAYNVTNQKTFDRIAQWRNEFMSQLGISASDNFPFLLLGNFSNRPNKVVQSSTAQEFADKNRMLFYEISTETDDSKINVAFDALIRKCLERAKK